MEVMNTGQYLLVMVCTRDYRPRRRLDLNYLSRLIKTCVASKGAGSFVLELPIESVCCLILDFLSDSGT